MKAPIDDLECSSWARACSRCHCCPMCQDVPCRDTLEDLPCADACYCDCNFDDEDSEPS